MTYFPSELYDPAPPSAPDFAAIGCRIRTLRTLQGLSQQTLAEAADLSPSYLCHVERGTKQVSLCALLRVAEALHTTTDALLTGSRGQGDGACLPEVQDLLLDCSPAERQFLLASAQAIKQCLRKLLPC